MADPGLSRFGIQDWRNVSSYDPRLYSENPESLYTDPLANQTSPDGADRPPGEMATSPMSSLGVSLTPSNTSTLFGQPRTRMTQPKARDASQDTMWKPPEPGPGAQPTDPVEDAYRRVITQPSAATAEDYWIVHNRDAAMNAQRLAQDPNAGVAMGGTSQHSQSSTTQTGTASSQSETQGTTQSASQQQGQSTQQTQLSPDAKESLAVEEELARQKGVNAQALGAAQAQYHGAEAEQLNQWAAAQQKMAVQAQRAQEAQQKRLEQIDRDMQLQMHDYEKMAKNMDPSRLISGPKSWLAALALGLGAFGATLGHTQNFAQQVIDQALNRDMESQRMALAAKKDQLSLTQQIYQNERTRFSSDQAAREATRAAMYQVFSTQQASRAEAFRGTESENAMQQSALNFASEAQKAKTQALMTENKTISQSTSIAQTQGQEQSSTAGFQSSRSQANTTSNTSGTSWTRQPTGAGMIDTVGTVGQIAEDAKKAKDAFKGLTPSKADEGAFGRAQTKLTELLDLQAASQELRRLNESTNFLSRATHLTDLSEEQRAALISVLEKDIRATTGAAASPEQLKRQAEKFLSNKYSSEGLNAALNQTMRLGRFAMGAQLAPLHPQFKEELLDRLRQSGFSDRDLQEIRTRVANPSETDIGTRFGLTPR